MISTKAPKTNLWAHAWRVLTSNLFFTIWLGLLGLLALLTLWLPQVPRGLATGSAELESWLNSVPPRLNLPARQLYELGLLTLTQSNWFRLLIAGASLTFLLRAFDALERLSAAVAVARGGRSRISGGDQEASEETQTEGQDGEASRQDSPPAAAALFPAIGSALAMVGALLAIAGWAWTDRAGWGYAQLALVEGESLVLEPTGNTLHLARLTVQWNSEGSRPAVSSELVVANGGITETARLGLQDNWRWHRVTYRLNEVGPALTATGTDAQGAALALQTAADRPAATQLTIPLSAAEGPRSFAAPDQGVVVQVYPQSTTGPPSLRLRAYQGRAGELVADQVLTNTARLNLEDSSFDLRVVPFARISVWHSPGFELTWSGIGLAAAGFALALAGGWKRSTTRATHGTGSTTLLSRLTGRKGKLPHED